MAIRVTKAITKYGRVYAVGDIIDTPTSVEESLRRLYGWEVLVDSPPSFSSMRKPELIRLVEGRGLDGSGLTKPELVDLLES